MITITQKIKLIQKCFGKVKLSGNEKNVSIVCPFCKEKGKITSKKKLSVDLETGIYHCWVCESKGRNIGRPAMKYSPSIDAAKELAQIFGGLKKSEEVIAEERLVLPDDFKLIANLSPTEVKKYRYHIKYNYQNDLSFSLIFLRMFHKYLYLFLLILHCLYPQ